MRMMKTMTRIFTRIAAVAFLAAALTLGGCTKDDDNGNGNGSGNMRVLTFEDADYQGISGSTNYWTALIDSPQNGGPLLYGDMSDWQAGVEYKWLDDQNTQLYSELAGTEYGTAKYWSGGFAGSNYVENDLTKGDPDHQLSVYQPNKSTGTGGRNGSANFAVYCDGSYGEGDDHLASLADLTFSDGEARVIDHLYVTSTTYFINVARNGNALSEAMADGDWVKITAIGYDAAGNILDVRPTFTLADGPQGIVTTWTKWDLSALGAVSKVKFDITSTVVENGSITLPAYFAIDDIAVKF